MLQREIKVCRELAQVEPNCKWVILTLAVLLGAVEAMNDNNKDASNDVQGSDTNVNDHSDSTAEVTEIRELFSTLRKLDPYREQYYTDVMQQLLSA